MGLDQRHDRRHAIAAATATSWSRTAAAYQHGTVAARKRPQAENRVRGHQRGLQNKTATTNISGTTTNRLGVEPAAPKQGRACANTAMQRVTRRRVFREFGVGRQCIPGTCECTDTQRVGASRMSREFGVGGEPPHAREFRLAHRPRGAPRDSSKGLLARGASTVAAKNGDADRIQTSPADKLARHELQSVVEGFLGEGRVPRRGIRRGGEGRYGNARLPPRFSVCGFYQLLAISGREGRRVERAGVHIPSGFCTFAPQHGAPRHQETCDHQCWQPI